MPKEPQGQKRPADVIGNAVCIAQIAMGETKETKLQKPAQRNSGLERYEALEENTMSKQCKETARKAVAARWG